MNVTDISLSKISTDLNANKRNSLLSHILSTQQNRRNTTLQLEGPGIVNTNNLLNIIKTEKEPDEKPNSNTSDHLSKKQKAVGEVKS